MQNRARSCWFVPVLLLALSFGSPWAQSGVPRGQGSLEVGGYQEAAPICLTASFGEAQGLTTALPLTGQADCSLTRTTIASEYEPENGITYQIPVVWHVISDSAGVGDIDRSFIDAQMKVLNEDFNALCGTNGALGNDARIWFYLADVDPDGNPTTGIERVTNDAWFVEQPQIADPSFGAVALAWDTNRYLNFYTKRMSGFGLATMPQLNFVGGNNDFVVLNYVYVGLSQPSPPYQGFGLGRFATHEVGHWAGLGHTFERAGTVVGGCPVGDCYESGDLICDTEPQRTPTFGCPPSSFSCGTPDPFMNYMDYSDHACMIEFTPEQVNRMRCSIQNWRPDVYRPLCYTLDFENEDDFCSALVNGQQIDTEFGFLVSITNAGDNAGAGLFDSTPGGPNGPSADPDLLVGSGNILILQAEDSATQTVPGIFDLPDDDQVGGTLSFFFTEPVTPTSVDLIDIDAGSNEAGAVVLTDTLGRTRTYLIPPQWTGDRVIDGSSGKRTLDLTVLSPQVGFASTTTAVESMGFASELVVTIDVVLGSSGGMDDLGVCQGSRAARISGKQSEVRGPTLR